MLTYRNGSFTLALTSEQMDGIVDILRENYDTHIPLDKGHALNRVGLAIKPMRNYFWVWGNVPDRIRLAFRLENDVPVMA